MQPSLDTFFILFSGTYFLFESHQVRTARKWAVLNGGLAHCPTLGWQHPLGQSTNLTLGRPQLVFWILFFFSSHPLELALLFWIIFFFGSHPLGLLLFQPRQGPRPFLKR